MKEVADTSVGRAFVYFFDTWYRWFLYASIFIVFFGTAATTHDPDFGWHLKIGKDILSTGAVPRFEQYLYPIQGAPWVDHEWLGNILLYMVYDAGPYGDMLLYGLFSALATGCLFLVEYIALRWFGFRKRVDISSRIFWISALQLFTVIALLPYFGVRLQVFSWLFFLLLFLLLFFFLEKRKRWILWLFPLLMLAWANMHGSFLLGIGLYFAAAIAGFYAFDFSSREKWHIALAGIAGIAITICTPYGIDLWKLVLIEYAENDYYKTNIDEWLPIYIGPPFETMQFILLPLFGALYIIMRPGKFLRLGILKKYPKIISPFIAAQIFFATLYLFNRRHIVFFLFFLMISAIAIFIHGISMKKVSRYFLYALLVPILFLIDLNFSVRIFESPRDPFTEQYSALTPRGAVDFLKNNDDLASLKIFNYYGWGGYIGWTYPEGKIFIDGRFPQMPIRGKGISYLEEYNRFFKDKQSLDELVREYDIQLVLLQNSALVRSTKERAPFPWNFFLSKKQIESLGKINPIYENLEDGWERIYSDDLSVLYRRK